MSESIGSLQDRSLFFLMRADVAAPFDVAVGRVGKIALHDVAHHIRYSV